MKARLMLIMAMLIFGTIGIFRRNIPLGSATVAAIRGLTGMVFLLLFAAVRRERLSFRTASGSMLLLTASGVALGLNWMLLFEAYNYTTVAVATLCYYMAPVFVVLASPFLFRERLTGRSVLCVLAAFAGIIFVSGVLEAGSLRAAPRGVVCGLLAAVFYAAVVLLNKKIGHVPVYERTIVQLGMAAAVLLPYAMIVEKPEAGALTFRTVMLLLLIGVVHTGAAYAMYFGSIKLLPVQTAALFGYIDPAAAIVLSAFVLSEKMGVYEIVGTCCILCAALVSELPGKKR